MSIFTSILSLFVIADDEFWTFFSRIASLCPFSAQALAFSDIARILGRKESTSRSDLHRGREQLKITLKEVYDFA